VTQAASNHVFIVGDWREHLPDKTVSLMIADPVYGSADVYNLVKLAVERKIPSCIFMWPDDVFGLPYKPEQLCHWVKPVSTKNTSQRYSRFVEVIAMWGVGFYEPLHWSNRTGVFTDGLFRNDALLWKKPESLIERLVRNHYPGWGVVYDPCAGTRTVEEVCKRRGISSMSVELSESPSSTLSSASTSLLGMLSPSQLKAAGFGPTTALTDGKGDKK